MGIPIDDLTSAELEAVNRRHNWLTGTLDGKGRLLGKGDKIFAIPDERVQMAVKYLGLAGKSVVEFGCLEGAHTVALCRAAASVTALEGRSESIEKAVVRLALYGASALVVKTDLETELPPPADVFFHSGVLYHLTDPVGHLLRICPLTLEMFLDTHYTRTPNDHYTPEDGKGYAFWRHEEDSRHPKSGLRKYARWLLLPDLLSLLRTFFRKVDVVRNEDERNGPRVSIVARERKP